MTECFADQEKTSSLQTYSLLFGRRYSRSKIEMTIKMPIPIQPVISVANFIPENKRSSQSRDKENCQHCMLLTSSWLFGQWCPVACQKTLPNYPWIKICDNNLGVLVRGRGGGGGAANTGKLWGIHIIHNNMQMIIITTVKEEIFVGKKFRTFPSKTVRMELNFVLSEWLKEVKTRDDPKVCKPGGRKFGMENNFVLFLFYESYEIKFHTKISSFTVCLEKKQSVQKRGAKSQWKEQHAMVKYSCSNSNVTQRDMFCSSLFHPHKLVSSESFPSHYDKLHCQTMAYCGLPLELPLSPPPVAALSEHRLVRLRSRLLAVRFCWHEKWTLTARKRSWSLHAGKSWISRKWKREREREIR